MLKVQVEEGGHLEDVVDADLRDFNEWFQAQGNDPMVGSEKAIIKTYLWWKVKGASDGTQASRGDSVQPVRQEGNTGGEAGDAAPEHLRGGADE